MTFKRVNIQIDRYFIMSKRLKSALLKPDIVMQKIEKEIINEGRVAGPFDKSPITTLRISPLAAYHPLV
jgi:hypothetical protein